MPISPAQKAAIDEVFAALLAVTAGSGRGRRHLTGMFMDLVDKEDYPEYYDLIPQPRALRPIQAGVEKGKYKEPLDVYTDIALVFWNAMFYNEDYSQIAMDAKKLKDILNTEWRNRPVLPFPRSLSPPPNSAQKFHGTNIEEPAKQEPESTPALPTPKATTSTLPPPVVAPVPVQPQPVASTSNHYPAIRPKTATQPDPTSDMDVDVVSPDSDDEAGPALHAERDPQSEEIVKQLEKGLPRWPGFGDEGWMEEISPERYSDIVHAIKSFKDIVGNRLAACLEAVPEESAPSLNLSSTTPISLKQIETRARHKMYKSSKEFDLDMARLFEKARRWHETGTEAYGRTLLLQRLYQALTSPNPPPPPYVSSTNFASLRAGPGNVKPVHGSDTDGVSNVTTHRVLTRDRTFVDEVNYKGWKIKLADWVHLSNPDDPSRPIIGQVFRCWTSDEADKKGQPGITVSWYYRPEQTFHPANRQFWEGEIFKTSHFADHPVEDIIEKVACQFTARHIRGRPRPPFWWVGFPLYVCDSRYNDRERVFVRIKNWNSCVPEEVRQSADFMPIYPFERTVYPVRLPSPFLVKGNVKPGSTKGPGGIIAGSATDQGEQAQVQVPAQPPAYRFVRPATETQSQPQQPQQLQAQQSYYRSHTGTPVQTLPATQTSSYQGNYAGASPAPGASGAAQAHASSAAGGQSQIPAYLLQPPYVPQPRVVPPGPDRSVTYAAGGLLVIGGPAQLEKLAPETAKCFDRDPETNEVLWFAAPPLNMPRAKEPRHSLAYLKFIAEKRKANGLVPEGEAPKVNGAKVNGVKDSEDGHVSKRARVGVPMTVAKLTAQAVKEVDEAERQAEAVEPHATSVS